MYWIPFTNTFVYTCKYLSRANVCYWHYGLVSCTTTLQQTELDTGWDIVWMQRSSCTNQRQPQQPHSTDLEHEAMLLLKLLLRHCWPCRCTSRQHRLAQHPWLPTRRHRCVEKSCILDRRVSLSDRQTMSLSVEGGQRCDIRIVLCPSPLWWRQREAGWWLVPRCGPRPQRCRTQRLSHWQL